VTRKCRTIEAFEYQWRHLPVGVGLLSDPRFRDDVERILWQEELCLERGWFETKRVLDVGCGNGRWTAGFLGLGCDVTAVDAAPSACEAVRERFGSRVEVLQADILDPASLQGREFDVVFAWGVLHHTGDARRALANCCALAARDGFVYVYMYGRGSLSRRTRLRLAAIRWLLGPLPPDMKRRVLAWRFRGGTLHNAFDVYAPSINDRFAETEVRAWFAAEGFSVRRTIEHTELFLEAWREGAAVDGAFLEPPRPPYWFQRLTAKS